MLSIRGLTHAYPNGVKALNQINLDIPKGMFGLLGPNGAGKSSLMRTIATLQQPSQGEISFDGIDVLRNPDALRRVLGYLPQDFGVYPRGSAYQQLDHLAILKGMTDRSDRRHAVDSLLQQTNLYEHRNKRLASFSGGMRQRFGVAQALLGQPKLIIVDEPTAGLDPEERNRFNNLLAAIGEDIVVILSTHIVEDVADLCPRMAIMQKGQLVVEGTPNDLKSAMKGRIWSRPIAADELREYQANHHVISSQLSAGKMVVRVESETAPTPKFQPSTATLEDVYFSAVQSGPPTIAPAAAV